MREKRLRGEGLTQAEIGERIGWTREQVKHYIAVLNTIGTEVLNLARGYQEGRVPENGTVVPTTTMCLKDYPPPFWKSPKNIKTGGRRKNPPWRISPSAGSATVAEGLPE